MKIETPLFVTIACALSWGILTVLGRIILLEYQLAPATFAFVQMFSGGLVLVLLSAKRIRSIGIAPLKQLHTWAFGGFRVLSASLYVGSLVYLTATNLAFLGALAVTLSVTFVWISLKRQPKIIEVPGHIVILIASYFLVMQLDGQFSNPGVWLLFGSEILIAIAIIFAEKHPLNQNNDSGDTLYLTGMVLLASATTLFILSYAMSLFEAQLDADFYPEIRQHITGFVLRDFFNPYVWGFGFLTGALFRSSAIYYSLRSVNLTSSEFYLGSMALMPYINMVFEYLAMKLGILPQTNFEPIVLFWGTVASLASIYIIFFKRSKN